MQAATGPDTPRAATAAGAHRVLLRHVALAALPSPPALLRAFPARLRLNCDDVHRPAQVKHVVQTDFSPAKGNALQACVATMLSLETLDEVPNFIE